jgi:DNA-binding CsgD family transcriptional regulator
MADSVLTFDQDGDQTADWSRELIESGFEVTTARNPREVCLLLAERNFSIAMLDEQVRNLGDERFVDWSFCGNARPKFVWVTREFSAMSVLNLYESDNLVLPSPLVPGVPLRAARLLASRRDEVADFSRRYGLSPREAELLRFALAGMNNDEAAAELDCSRATVASFWNRIFRKTGVRGQRDVIILLHQTSRTAKGGVFAVNQLDARLALGPR